MRRLRTRNPLLDLLMRSLAIEVGDVLAENRAKMILAKNDEVIETFAPHAPNEPFDN